MTPTPRDSGFGATDTVATYGVQEIVLEGPSDGNPFVDVELTATITGPTGAAFVRGFYDGDGTYRVRYSPQEPGRYRFETASNAPSLDGAQGSFEATQQRAGHGPVRVRDTFHFAYADGTRHVPVGTTSYAWTHQTEALQRQTLDTLSRSPFNKMRMGVFPKSYLFNHNEPDRFPFPRGDDGGFDLQRFDVEFWRHLEQQVRALGELGIEADLILFHPYDRWGFATMSAEVDDAYVRYAVARLGAYSNVWWSLANEFDLMSAKTVADWERIAGVIQAEDASQHLRSIHNCFGFYDHGAAWITHASLQRQDLYKTAEMTTEWRAEWSKPVVIDECGYEGDIDQGWGSLTGQELVRRFWEGAIRGGYVGHGETYFREDEVLWWSKGGQLHGSSPERIALLRGILEDAPDGLEPIQIDWDTPSAGVENRYYLFYYGFNQPRFRRFEWDPAVRYRIDVIDTWNMTIERLPGEFSGAFTVDLPGRPYMALRFQAVDS